MKPGPVQHWHRQADETVGAESWAQGTRFLGGGFGAMLPQSKYHHHNLFISTHILSLQDGIIIRSCFFLYFQLLAY